MSNIELYKGDCIDELKKIKSESIDAIITDPPYGLGEVKDIEALLLAWLNDNDINNAVGKNGFMGKE